jgi:hypothetical protein
MSEIGAYSVKTSRYLITLTGTPKTCRVTLTVEQKCQELDEVHIPLTADQPMVMPELVLSWDHPLIQTHHVWHPGCGTERTINASWNPTICYSKATFNAPVVCLY